MGRTKVTKRKQARIHDTQKPAQERWKHVGKKSVEEAVVKLGFPDFRAYLLARSTWSFRRMAEELGLPEHRVIVYHTAWIHERREKGEVPPLRLSESSAEQEIV